MLRLELHQLLEEAVVFGVRDLGLRLVVVEPVVPLDRAAQLLGASREILRAHGLAEKAARERASWKVFSGGRRMEASPV